MLTKISFVYNLLGFIYHLFKNDDKNEDDFNTEVWVAEKIMEFEFAEIQKEPVSSKPNTPDIPRNTTCFHRTGVITLIEYPTVMIDGHIFFDFSSCSLSLNINDKVTYLGYKNDIDQIVVTRILENHGTIWETWDEDKVEESKYEIIDHMIVAEVESRQERFVYLKENDLKFNLDDVEGTMVPIVGDWLELKCSVQLDDGKPYNINGSQVVKVTSYKPLRTKIKSAMITEWDGTEGSCDGQIYFNKQSLPSGAEFPVGQMVLIEAIESNQGSCTWRALKLVPTGGRVVTNVIEPKNTHVNTTLDLENEKGLEITHPVKFEKVDFKQTAQIKLCITNRSDQVQIFNKWLIPSKMRDSQINVNPSLSKPYKLYPNQTYSLNITCKPKFLGSTKETLILFFKGLKAERTIEINVVDNDWLDNNKNHTIYHPPHDNVIAQMNKVRQNVDFIPGPKLKRNPHFVAGKLGLFPIPDRVWSAVLGDSTQVIHTLDFNNITCRIENAIPCLAQDLSINNYSDRWHNLLYLEEIQENINIRVYDRPKTFLINFEEYLALEITGLSERRPSLIVGDKAIVKDLWNNHPSRYEGIVHAIRGDVVLMKFHSQFQESYSGSDVSIEFHFSRTKYRKSHNAINRAITNLGHEMLFPTKLQSRGYQLPPEKLDSIQWFNKQLNDGQKEAVSNILLGQCRPKPYLIYGPPGTGKTITVIETILQILEHFPDSRIIVGTPSNSAANIITERLIQYKERISNSFTRIIAHHLVESDKIPHGIKPFCATLNIALDGTSKTSQRFHNGIRVECQASYIGRQRVTIGTCNTLSTLSIMYFPKGHFTHIIIDEAGQCTEPEIMNVLTFTDKDNGQIILAGDPMQLGPVISSRYAAEFGMGDSYLCRLLDSFPYQKDFAAFKSGFNEKLVTKLNDNYRSLSGVITLPSQMFYDGSLVPRMNPKQEWIENIVRVMNKIFDLEHSENGGIYVNGIRGENARAQDSPSWYNRHEASMVAMTTCELYKQNITADDIGIITPYIAQIKYLRIVFESLGLPEPKIGTVEEFQGQERPLIIISTVRSSSAVLDEDVKNQLGFVKNPKRLNVAITRARAAVLLVCDPHLLITDPLWSKIINQAVEEDKYMGCDLPNTIEKKMNKEF